MFVCFCLSLARFSCVCVCIFHEFPVHVSLMWQLKLHCDTMAAKFPILFVKMADVRYSLGFIIVIVIIIAMCNWQTHSHKHTLNLQRLRSFLTHTNANTYIHRHTFFFDSPISHLYSPLKRMVLNGSKHV